MFYVQDHIVIHMADFFPLNKHSIDDKFQRLQQRIEKLLKILKQNIMRWKKITAKNIHIDVDGLFIKF